MARSGSVEVEAVDGSYTLRGEMLVIAPVEAVRGVLADDRRLVEWVPHASWGAGPTRPGQVRLEVGAHLGPTDHVGTTTLADDGTIGRDWAITGSTSGWQRHVRWAARAVPGGTRVDVEVVTRIPGARARPLRAGGRAEAEGLDRALVELALLVEGPGSTRRRRRGAGPAAGPL